MADVGLSGFSTLEDLMDSVQRRWLRRMHAGLLLLVSAFAAVPEINAQTLDIGGIELRLGQDVSSVLSQFATYKIVYSEGAKAWFVNQEVQAGSQTLGHFRGANGRVVAISKAFTLWNETDLQSVYTAALNETRRRGGQVCRVRNVEYADDLVRSIETRCGRYVLSYSFPFKFEGSVVTAGISVTLADEPPDDRSP